MPDASTARRPESRVQLALDQTMLAAAERLVQALLPRLRRLEIGTPLLLAAGSTAIERVRACVGDAAHLVADTKICDAGERTAVTAYAAGADAVTVVATAIDRQTWAGVLSAAKAAGRTRLPRVLIDTIGCAPASLLDHLRAVAIAARVPFEVCVHRGKTDTEPFPRLAELARGGAGAAAGLLVAGRIGAESASAAFTAGFDTVIVGDAVAGAANPSTAWARLLDAVPTDCPTRRRWTLTNDIYRGATQCRPPTTHRPG